MTGRRCATRRTGGGRVSRAIWASTCRCRARPISPRPWFGDDLLFGADLRLSLHPCAEGPGAAMSRPRIMMPMAATAASYCSIDLRAGERAGSRTSRQRRGGEHARLDVRHAGAETGLRTPCEGRALLLGRHRNRRPPQFAGGGAGGAGRCLRHRLCLRGPGAALPARRTRRPGGDRPLAVRAGPPWITRAGDPAMLRRGLRAPLPIRPGGGARRAAAPGFSALDVPATMTASSSSKRRWRRAGGLRLL